MNIRVLLLATVLCGQAAAQRVDTSGRAFYFGCFVQGNVVSEYQNWERDSHSFPEGIYYGYTPTYVSEWGMVIGFLVGRGVPIKEVWFKQGESNCHGEQTQVPASLLIRVAKPVSEEFMRSFGFARTRTPGPGGCPHNVLHVLFEQPGK